MVGAYTFIRMNSSGIMLDVNTYSTSMPDCPSSIRMISLPDLPAAFGSSYEQAKEKAMEACRLFPMKGELGDAIRRHGETGSVSQIHRVWNGSFIPDGFKSSQVVMNDGAVIGNQTTVCGTTTISFKYT